MRREMMSLLKQIKALSFIIILCWVNYVYATYEIKTELKNFNSQYYI